MSCRQIYQRISLFLIWRLPRFLTRFLGNKQTPKPKTLLIIRTDAIGDYILFRNFLQSIRTSEKYQAYHITLLGNSVWKNLAENLDKQQVNQFIWIDRNRFLHDLFYHLNFMLKIYRTPFESVIYPAFSREFFYGDYLVRFTPAVHKIGQKDDDFHASKITQNIPHQIYTQLIETPTKTTFEFLRNRLFFEQLLSHSIALKKPYIYLSNKKKYVNTTVIFFVGASEKFRQWSASNFAQLADFITDEFDTEIHIYGGKNDAQIGDEIKRLATKSTIHNYCGQTSLVEFLERLSLAKCLISNETMAVHAAASLDIPTICISNGNHLGRFNPYPQDIAPNVHTIYPTSIQENLHDHKKFEQLCLKYARKSDESIHQIPPENVWALFQKIIQNP